jgi:galactokinase/mevalonate kinase-like predicted kinase
MSAQQKLTKDEIEHLLNLVREHWPEVYQYEEGITNKALNRIQEIAEKEGVASITPPRLVGLRELYEEHFLVFFMDKNRLRQLVKPCKSLNQSNQGSS